MCSGLHLLAVFCLHKSTRDRCVHFWQSQILRHVFSYTACPINLLVNPPEASVRSRSGFHNAYISLLSTYPPTSFPKTNLLSFYHKTDSVFKQTRREKPLHAFIRISIIIIIAAFFFLYQTQTPVCSTSQV